MVRIVEVKSFEKNYNDVMIAGFSKHKHLKQKMYQVANNETIPIEKLSEIMNRASKSAPDKAYSIIVASYFENAGWRSGNISNLGGDISLYNQTYDDDENLGNIKAWIVYYLPRMPPVR